MATNQKVYPFSEQDLGASLPNAVQEEPEDRVSGKGLRFSATSNPTDSRGSATVRTPPTTTLPTPVSSVTHRWPTVNFRMSLIQSTSSFFFGSTVGTHHTSGDGSQSIDTTAVRGVGLTSSMSFRKRTRLRTEKWARIIVDNKIFVGFSVILTIWALTGDDMRVMLTDRPADVVFDSLTIFCILFFTLEVLLSCAGKDDYFMGFFFGLDCISTVTLVLDLTYVADALFNGGDDNQTDKARSSKTARAGARVGRVVRVLRLVRIVKLFKAWQQSRNEAATRKRLGPGAMEAKQSLKWPEESNGDDDDDEDDENQQEGSGRESLVGKKLSNRTTQRTILLVLVMLISLPLLSTESYMRTPASAEYAADDILQAFNRMVAGTGSRDTYEEVVLKYLYYHNWFLSGQTCPHDAACASWFYSQVFWIGIEGTKSIVDSHAVDAQLREDTVEAWNIVAAAQDNIYNYGTMPSQVLKVVASAWDQECDTGDSYAKGFSLLESQIDGIVTFAAKCPKDLRLTEFEKFTPRLLTAAAYEEYHFVFYFDLRPYTHDEALFNLLKTVFVCVVLCIASLLFSSDANTLVLQPVEHMIHKVEQIRDNPLSAMKIADEEFNREEMKRVKKLRDGAGHWLLNIFRNYFKPDSHDLMETVILEKTIIKLGSLLALGFGEAGTEIVRHNMKGSSSAFVDAMIEGKKVECILGNARIQDFSIATEVLQAKVMTFVNQVAEIVHGIVDQFHGAVNKNKGDAFLVIWRVANSSEGSRFADMSVMAFTRIVAAVSKSTMLAQYRLHPGLQQRLRERCRVNLSFGLHCGWAIEGAVGSEFKIDASYLSPNVSISASVEQAARSYEVCLMVSEAVKQLCSIDMALKLRLIDKVRIRGSKQPLELYCMDLDYLCLPVDDDSEPMPVWNTQQRYHSRRLLEQEKLRKLEDTRPFAQIFEADPEIQIMRELYGGEFRHVFSMGYQNYVEGEWRVARTFLTRTQHMLRAKDGPSGALLKYMDSFQFEAPSWWQGVHDLEGTNDL